MLSRGLSWENARRECLGSGGDLVSIASQSEMSFVSNKSLWNQHYWIGLNDRRNESLFVWSDGTPYNASVYSNWHPGEPNDRAGEDCVELFRARWNDNGCNDEFGYICEKPKGKFWNYITHSMASWTQVQWYLLDCNWFISRKNRIWAWIYHMVIGNFAWLNGQNIFFKETI